MRPIIYRAAHPDDISTCIIIRGQTRENAISETRLNALGITQESWSQSVQVGELPGVVAEVDSSIIGYCFGDGKSGEIVVLALLPEFEGLGAGKELLNRVIEILRSIGHKRLFLGCSSNSAVRAYKRITPYGHDFENNSLPLIHSRTIYRASPDHLLFMPATGYRYFATTISTKSKLEN